MNNAVHAPRAALFHGFAVNLSLESVFAVTGAGFEPHGQPLHIADRIAAAVVAGYHMVNLPVRACACGQPGGWAGVDPSESCDHLGVAFRLAAITCFD